MGLQQLGEQLQALLARTERRQKWIHNMVLGVTLPDAGFRWSGAAGVADPAAGRVMRPETPFLIASVTKMHTAATVMLLHEEGRLSLDAHITEYLAADLVDGIHRYRGNDHSRTLTVRHLITQTSGLPDYFLAKPKSGKSAFQRLLAEGDRAWELNDVLQYTREQLPPVFAPVGDQDAGREPRRGKAHYSDTNFKLLGAILEAVTGTPLHALFEEMIFRRLGLANTYLYGHPRAGVTAPPARVFYRNHPFELDMLMRSHGPEGGIVSTLDDTLRFGQALMSGHLFADERTLLSMQRWNPIFFPLQYGYGLMRFRLPRLLSPFGFSPELIGHSGSSGSFLYHCPELNLYLAGTINQMALQRAPFPLMIRIARMVERALR